VKQQIERTIEQYVATLLDDGAAVPKVVLTRSKQKSHGDYACNVAMQLARPLKQSPASIAHQLIAEVAWPDGVIKAEIAGPGFINIFLQQSAEAGVLHTVLQQGEQYGCLPPDMHKPKVNLEFVSANPTGPMHVGHCRGACVGDALANLLVARGFPLQREYYINDAGAQIGVLAKSVWLRMRELQGESIELADGCYPGAYVVEIARSILEDHPFVTLLAMDSNARQQLLGKRSVAANMAMIRDDLAALNITFDCYFSETELHDSGAVATLIANLQNDGLVYRGTLPPPKGKEIEDYQPIEQLLFRTTTFGDSVDRPLQKQDGSPTYFAADIAYHHNKQQRGFSRQIDIWGADHGGYVARVQAAVEAVCGFKKLGIAQAQPEVLLVQMVNLMRDGQPVKMSKRAGTFVTLREVVNEVGADAVRFNFLTRRVESQLDFDLESAKKQSEENPVYYVQYAHARCAAIVRRAKESGIIIQKGIATKPLTSDEERKLIALLTEYPSMLEHAAQRLEPYRIAIWLMALAAAWHRFYHKHRVVVDDVALCQARLLLVHAVQQVIANGLTILGVTAPDRM